MPEHPKIFHITHVDNLPAIIAEGCLVSDRVMIGRGGPAQAIGMSSIKSRRVEELEVPCHPGTKVGDYVPFYFCPRSIMLSVIWYANRPELTYRGGQGPIVHLVADVQAVVQWAEERDTPWCFSQCNAGSYYAQSTFRSQLEDLGRLNWGAIQTADFREPDVKEGKQAEFLLHDKFPIELIERVGVHSPGIQATAASAFANVQSPPPVELRPKWYF